MTDYGLELQLGLFATPDASRPAANVANLPLRPPVVLARSVAILDLLSAGRAELGLGAGAFTDAIVAAGGERRSPKEAVDALIEGIDVIRQTWGVVGNRSVTVGGKHYQVKGLTAGPAPAHNIEIWLGAYKPRMLRVTARLADGWLPSMGYLELSELPAMNAAIDEAAIAAGRHPSDIRRMLNISGRFGGSADLLQGTTADWAEQLAELALREGISCYLLGTDDPSDVVLFADEVAPALRELVAAERERAAARTPSSAVDSAVTSAVVSQPTVSQPTVGRPTAGQQAGSSVVAPTPDDGERLTGELDWHEELRPVADGAGSTDGLSDEQLAVPQHLIDVHNGLRQELAQVRDITAQVLTGDAEVGAARSAINQLTMRQNNWTLGAYCESYCRIVAGHHGLEDRGIFPHLRRSERSLGPVIDRLTTEHEVIADVLDRLDRALIELVAGTAGSRQQLRRAIDELTDTLLSHLAWEEKMLLRPLAIHGFY